MGHILWSQMPFCSERFWRKEVLIRDLGMNTLIPEDRRSHLCIITEMFTFYSIEEEYF